MKKPVKKLTPPDKKRCQAEYSNGVNFMTLGGRHEMIRCAAKPTVIVTEVKPGKDGLKGSMSLCNACLEQLFEKMGPSYATAKSIKKEKR